MAAAVATAPPPTGRGRQRRPTRENMLDKDNLLSGCDEFGTRIRIFTATMTGEREVKAHLGKFTYTGTTIPADGEMPSDVTATEEVVDDPGEKSRLASGRVRHGYGEIKYQSGSIFKGQWAFNKREGKGTFIYPCGDVYEGEWKAGKYHGHGKYTSDDSAGRALEYEGEWVSDKMEGHGKYIYKDTGDVYEGSFINGFREGFGKYTTATGDVYMGEYDGGELQSKTQVDKEAMQSGTDETGRRIQFFTASLTCVHAKTAGLGKFVYTGETISEADNDMARCNDMKVEAVKQAPGDGGRLASGRVRHGHGEVKYESGSIYVGHWEHNKRFGNGKYTFASGDVYEGEWLAGMYHGHGKYASADSDEYEGQWQQDKMTGHGVYRYHASGDIYEGEWIGGLTHGFGKYTVASTGEVYMGEYENGQLKSRIKIDKESMQSGTDEWGKRIHFFTATLTGEQAIRAGLGNFKYTGETIGSADGAGGQTKMAVKSAPGGRLQGTSRGRLASGRVRHGYGEIKYESGMFYAGQWEHDKRVGNGKYTFACGDIYEGEWKAGQFHGKGKYISASSDEYEGEWKFDKMDGHGRYHYRETGDVYEGSFVNGVCEGRGKYTTASTGVTTENEYTIGKLRKRRSSQEVIPSFIESGFTQKVEYEAWVRGQGVGA